MAETAEDFSKRPPVEKPTASDYTPTTETIRDRIVSSNYTQGDQPDLGAAFDRWLAAHDAEVYQRGREDEKAVWMNPCWRCGMNSDSAYICDECAADFWDGERSE